MNQKIWSMIEKIKNRRFLLGAICSSIIFLCGVAGSNAQDVPGLPPPPLPTDKELVRDLIARLLQSLHTSDKIILRSVFGVDDVRDEMLDSLRLFRPTHRVDIDTIQTVNGNARVRVNFFDPNGVLLRREIVKLQKNGMTWIIDSIKSLNRQNHFGMNLQPTNLPKKPSNETFSSPTIVMSEGMMINIPHPYTTGMGDYIFSRSYTTSNFGKSIFGRGARLKIDALYLSSDMDNTVIFYLDKTWNRILYAQKSGNWMKSYGDGASDHQFNHVSGLTVDGLGTVYVTDEDDQSIVQLYYNPSSSLLQYVASIHISDLVRPQDISIDQSGTGSSPTAPANDRIWIADDFSGQLASIGRDGLVKQRITQYNVGGILYPTRHVSKLCMQEQGNRLGFIDYDRMAFVLTSIPSPSTLTAIAIRSTEFSPSTSDLSSIGVDANNEWWVCDSKASKVHKFTSDGLYLASYSGSTAPSGSLSWPVAITKSPNIFTTTPPSHSQYQYVSDLWDNATGIRAYFPGTGALNLSYNVNGGYNSCTYSMTYILTNKSYAKGTLYQGTTALKTYDYGVLEAGNQVAFIDANYMGTANYHFTLELKPYLWSSYGISGLGWQQFDKTFSTSANSAIGGHISADQECYPAMTTGVWTFSTGCPGAYAYQWYINYSPGTSNWTLLSSYTSAQISFTVGNEYFQLRCKITNQVPGGTFGYAYYTNCPPPPPPGGCPYVYTYDSLGVRGENNILPQSEYPGNEEKVVTDYYQLVNPPLRENGKHILEIREFEAERSYFKEFKLLAVDHPIDTRIAVLTDGKIVEYTTPFLLNQVNNGDFELSDNHKQLDLKIDKGRAVELDFIPSEAFLNTSVSGKTRFALVLGGSVRHRINEVESLPKEEKVGVVLVTNGNIQSGRGAFNFRERYSLAYFPLDTLRLHLKVHFFQDVELDFAALAVETDSALQATEIPISSAIHSRKGDVLSSMSGALNQDATLNPGEILTLTFSNQSNESETANRDFVLVSKGQYEHIKNLTGEIPKDYSLAQSYPNPFNPLCTIKYAIPEAGRVTLKVYNILGAEVATLMNGYQDAGYKATEFNASQLPSGIYYYRLTAGDFTDIKKMLLIK